jgi:hypothetical protein
LRLLQGDVTSAAAGWSCPRPTAAPAWATSGLLPTNGCLRRGRFCIDGKGVFRPNRCFSERRVEVSSKEPNIRRERYSPRCISIHSRRRRPTRSSKRLPHRARRDVGPSRSGRSGPFNKAQRFYQAPLIRCAVAQRVGVADSHFAVRSRANNGWQGAHGKPTPEKLSHDQSSRQRNRVYAHANCCALRAGSVQIG